MTSVHCKSTNDCSDQLLTRQSISRVHLNQMWGALTSIASLPMLNDCVIQTSMMDGNCFVSGQPKVTESRNSTASLKGLRNANWLQVHVQCDLRHNDRNDRRERERRTNIIHTHVNDNNDAVRNNATRLTKLKRHCDRCRSGMRTGMLWTCCAARRSDFCGQQTQQQAKRCQAQLSWIARGAQHHSNQPERLWRAATREQTHSQWSSSTS